MSTLDILAGATPPKPATATHGIRVIPYNAIYDPQADAFLPWMWKKMQTDDLVDYYFPGQKDTGFATFVRMFSGDAQVALIAVDSATKQWDDTIAGFITWTPTAMGASEMIVAGFIFFRKFWDHHTTDEAGVRAFDYWFKETNAQCVLGLCPALHATAMRYNKRVGLHEIGRIPLAHLYKGQPCDAVLFAITREEWAQRGRN